MNSTTRVDLHALLTTAASNNDRVGVQSALLQEPLLVNRLVTEANRFFSLLYVAAAHGFVETAKLLLDAKANVNQQCYKGRTPLMIASAAGFTEMVKLLLEQPEIEIDLCDDLRHTPLQHARANKHQTVVDLLLRKNATTSTLTGSDLPRRVLLQKFDHAVSSNNVDTVSTILQQEPWLVNRLAERDLSHQHFSFLMLSAGNGSVEISAALIAAKANVNQQCTDGETPLTAASAQGHEEVVRLLLAQPDIIVDTMLDNRRAPLSKAAENGHAGVAQQLLDANVAVDAVDDNGDTALLAAANAGQLSAVQLLLKHGANANQQSHFGDCCLHWAARDGRDDIAAALFDAKAVVGLCDSDGVTPLMTAAAYGHLSTANLLLAAGSDLAHCSDEQNTALHEAAAVGHVAIVKTFLSANADPNAVNVSGYAPLTFAAIRNYTDCMQLLLAAKADIDHADHYGDTALVMALMNGRAAASNLLMERGANFQKRGTRSARQAARRALIEIDTLFACSLCGWDGMCCRACRHKFCATQCDKFSDKSVDVARFDCRLHRKIAHEAVLEWAIAMSFSDFPPYVLEHIFDSLKVHSNHNDYQQRRGIDFLWLPEHTWLNVHFVHLIVEERTHVENIRLFIAVKKACQKAKQ